MVRPEVEVGHPLFGKMMRCPNNPPEADDSLRARLRNVGNLRAFEQKTFDNFSISESHSPSDRESLQHALNMTYRFAENPRGWILLEGTYGCGKTHLAAAIANVRLDYGEIVLFVTVPDLLDHLRSAYGPSSEMGYDDLFERVRNIPLLILDDLGVENPSAWAQEKLFQLLNHRYVNHLPTIITTNTDIDRLDPRIRSRLLDVNLVSRVKISAPDYRSLSQNQQTQLQTTLSRYNHYTFDTFDVKNFLTGSERQNIPNAFRFAQSYVQDPRGWVIFTGPHGVGKTHLAAAIGHERQLIGDEVMFITVPDLMDYLRVTFNPGAVVTFDQRFNAVKNVDLLILDDLGADNATPWAKEKLFQLLDYRYVSRMRTVMTSPKTLEKMEERIFTRLVDESVCAGFVMNSRPWAVRSRDKYLKP